MKMFPSLEKRYCKEHMSAIDAQRLAHEISFGPIVFEVSRLMVKFGIFQMLTDSKDGLTMEEIADKTKLSDYAVKVMMEASLTIGTVLYENERFTISKAGWFVQNDPLVRVDMDFNHDVNYIGWFNLEEALVNGKPEGLRHFGGWPTIYEGLSQLPPQVQKSWFAFDHYYSDQSFEQALEIVFADKPRTLLDVGGNTGRFATNCVRYDNDVNVTIMDLPQQLEMMRRQTAEVPGADRIHGHGADLLDDSVPFPEGFDTLWMSQFLDCFSKEQVISILRRAARSMSKDSSLYIMETLWDRQRFESASYCLTMISLYFTALANGNSKMFHSEDLFEYIDKAGLKVEKIWDGLGKGHSLIKVKTK